jgi:hypothetical protein
MSARKAEPGSITHQVTLDAPQKQLHLSPSSIVLRKSGIEFRSPSSFPSWTEVTLTLCSPFDGGKIRCNGVVISCTGNKHAGYHISMLFTNLSKQAEARLSAMALAL